MDTWCFNVKSRKSLLVTPDGGTPGLPTWYKEPTHALIQQDAHKCILAMGATIHQQYMEEANSEHKETLEEAKTAILYLAKMEKEEAVKNALLEAEKIKKKEIEILKKEHMNAVKEAIRKTEAKMQWQQELQVSKERELGKQRLAHEIQQTLYKCEIAKTKALNEAIEKEQEMSTHVLHQMVTQLKSDAETQSQFNLQEGLDLQKIEFENKIKAAVAEAHEEEKANAKEPILILQSRHQSEIDMLKRLLCEKEVDLKEVYNKVETMTVLEFELETELRNTRQAFQDYINLTFPNLAPGQADFILPPRSMCHDLPSALPFKPHKAQKRPQEK
ncbi:uncharacterized protein C6orf163 homolog [Scyliorhinus canicula]|uniref:uncharacterized protein C6orf163 homolog n=1 Tax=Scyliorhinus canicula TaxID=7830 RepID=UPI0018F73B8D|nr:uncharacterized protein C6orf163 homolog [Scyliorhinus canicula]